MKNFTINKRLKWAFIFNALIVALEVVGLILSIQKHGIRVFKYYTENSNYFTLIVSAIFCIYFLIAKKRKTKIASWVIKLRFISTICLTITYVIVTLVLVPMYPASFYSMLFAGSGLYQHFLCPVLSILSFLLFESQLLLSKRTIPLALVPTIAYGIVCIVLNLLKLMTGPYPFFYVYDIPWYATVLSIVGILVCSVLIAYLFFKIFNYVFKLKQKHN